MLELYFAPQLEEFQPWIIHTGVHMFVGFWMQRFQTGGLGEMIRHPGNHYRRISPPPLLPFMGVC